MIPSHPFSRSKRLASMLAAVCVGVILTTAQALPAADTYYSIHLASFSHLKNANSHINRLGKHGKIVFWREVMIPDKGRFYRVFIGNFKSYGEALRYWEELKKQGMVSYKGIFQFDVSGSGHLARQPLGDDSSRPLAALPATRVPDAAIEPPSTPVNTPPAGPSRFEDNGDGTITDHATGLMWVKNGWRIEFFSALSWADAQEKCRQFHLAGYADWRLPTVEQWRSIIDKHQQYPALIDPNPFENIIVHMPYWSDSSPDRYVTRAYVVMLYSGNINHQKKDELAFIMPVRSIN